MPCICTSPAGCVFVLPVEKQEYFDLSKLILSLPFLSPNALLLTFPPSFHIHTLPSSPPLPSVPPYCVRAMQEVQLDKHVKLLDSPGIVMAKDKDYSAAILRNSVRVSSVSVVCVYGGG